MPKRPGGWARLYHDFWDNKKVLDLRAAEKLGYLASITWCHENDTDGHIPTGAVRKIDHLTPKVADRLVEVGLYARNGNGWVIHDYTDHQDSSEVRRERAEKAAARQQRFREKGAT